MIGWGIGRPNDGSQFWQRRYCSPTVWNQLVLTRFIIRSDAPRTERQQEPVTADAVAGFPVAQSIRLTMESYVKQRLAEIKANPALRRKPAKPLSFRNQAAKLARWLAVLGNRYRFLAVVHLIGGEKTVGELAALIGHSQSALSQHFALLTKEGIVEPRADGVRRYYSCKSEAAKAIVVVLDSLAKGEKLPTGRRR
ncbi:ArsR/SmtB family transcription factor [Mesorhizobium sp. 113-3-3]|uniref:ArsR/SmtB family transcription factor n=1 Tax=Mesorhizobium sp. 113-3-3 TaxID=2744516 RepID=UPI001FD07376|nr:metalloregulator ArsR/SmtB family transcription factor [Mesorhizobium sp. 113-3-3]